MTQETQLIWYILVNGNRDVEFASEFGIQYGEIEL